MSHNIKCVDCGYLFGFSENGIGLENKEFDPDILRQLESERVSQEAANDFATSRNYTWEQSNLAGNTWTKVSPYRWGYTNYIGCFRNKFKKINVAVHYRETPEYPGVMLDVFDADTSKLSIITHAERNCNLFIPYKVGLTARQHEKLENRLLFEQKKSQSQWSGQLHQIYDSFLSKVRTAQTNDEKKHSLEYLAEFIFGTIDGLNVIDKDLRTSAEEIDRLIRNESNEPFWRNLGNPIFIECKNWEEPVSAATIRDIKGKMESRNVKTTFLFAKNGITGNKYKDARLEVRQALGKGIYLIVLSLDDLERIAQEKSPLEKLREAYETLYRI
jgi:hypothetical protein